MLEGVKQWLSAISEDAARRAVGDVANDLLRFAQQVEIDRQTAAEIAAATQARLDQLTASAEALKQEAAAVQARLDQLSASSERELADQSARITRLADETTRMGAQLDQRHGALTATLLYALRGLLFTNQGTTVVKTSREHIAGVFSGLSDRLLLELAEALATLAPLEPTRHARFGDFENSADLAVHIRHALWLSAKARGLREPVIVPWHYGTRLALHLENDLSLTLYASGHFEANEFAFLDRVLGPGMVFLDGGANEGLYTIFASAKVGGEGRVIAVEPSPRELARLRRNVEMNNARTVEIVEAALAEQPGVLSLQVAEDEHSGQNTVGAFAYEGVKTTTTTEVEATTIDDIVRQHALAKIDVIKLDIEGAEIRALRGADTVLREMRPLLLVEVSEASLRHQSGSPVELRDFLKGYDYVMFDLDEETAKAVPITDETPARSTNVIAVHSERAGDLLER